MHKFLFAFLLFIAAIPAHAKDYGKWLCPYCLLAGVGETLATNQSNVVKVFIVTEISRSSLTQPAPGDIFTVCNGESCVMAGRENGDWSILGAAWQDSGENYKNSKKFAEMVPERTPPANFRSAQYRVDVVGQWELHPWTTGSPNGPGEGITNSGAFWIFSISSISYTYIGELGAGGGGGDSAINQ